MKDQLLDEVDADLRAAELSALWKRHHKKLIIAIVLLVLGTAVNSVWSHYEQKRGGERLVALTHAQELYTSGKFTEAAAAFGDIAPTTRGDTRTLALLWQGRALMAAGKKEEAVTALKTAASARASLWADLACLRLAGLDSSAATGCLAATADSPLIAQRRAWAAASDWNAGNNSKAATTLEELATSDSVTEQTRAEVREWLTTIRAGEKPAQ